MTERPVQLEAILSGVRRRWMYRSIARASTLGAAAVAVVVLAGWAAVALIVPEGILLLVVSALVLVTAAFAILHAGWSVRRAPTDRQIARFIEERESRLDDVVATAVDYGARPDASARMRDALYGDAARALSASGLDINVDPVISRDSVRTALLRAAAAVAVLAIAVVGFTPSLSRAINVASAYLFPARLTVDVMPGSTKVRAGDPVTITARIGGLEGEVVPALTIAVGDDTRTVRMSPAGDAGSFAVTIEKVTASFAYTVTAAKTRSGDYTISVIRPPRVERIDLHYQYPGALVSSRAPTKTAATSMVLREPTCVLPSPQTNPLPRRSCCSTMAARCP